MNTNEKYKQMKDRHQKEFNEFPMIFAFSKKQLSEGMKKLGLEPTDFDKIYKYSDTGGFFRKTDAQKLQDMIKRQDKELSESILVNDEFALEAFEYELINHEYPVTLNEDDALLSLGLEMRNIKDDKRLCRLLNKAKKNALKKSSW